MTIDEARANIGRFVEYRPRDTPDAGPERGVIAAVGHVKVFVWHEGLDCSQATDPADLTLAAGESAAREDHEDG
jgi:hypothetical protein